MVLSQERARAQEGGDLPKEVVWIAVMGRLLRVAPKHLRALSEREERHLTLQCKQPIDTERFTEKEESTDFQDGTFLDLRQQPGPSDEHVSALHSQLVEPPNFAEQLLRGRGHQRQAQSDSTAGASQKSSKPSGSDETLTTET